MFTSKDSFNTIEYIPSEIKLRILESDLIQEYRPI